MFYSFLDNDLYKLLMSQFAYYYYPETVVTYKLTNRKSTALRINPKDLWSVTRGIAENATISDEELVYLNNLTFSSFYSSSQKKVFSTEFLEDLKDNLENHRRKIGKGYLIPIIEHPKYDEQGFLNFEYTGLWWTSILFEVPFLSVISEMDTKIRLGGSPDVNFVENFVKEFNELPNSRSIRFSDFGTRRRQSFDSHQKVIQYLLDNLPDTYNLGGTSNMHFAKEFNLNPVGTFAHELPMVISGVLEQEGKDPRDAYPLLMDQWSALYKGAYSILLPDTFGSYWLFDNCPEKVVSWEGVRHDSGDPFEFGDYYISLCNRYNIDPMSKVIVFSDSLTPQKMQDIFEYFQGRVWITFGIGTNLTHNTYVSSPDIVIKAHQVEDVEKGRIFPLVKLSDEKGKYTGNSEKIEKYLELYGYK